MRLCGGRKMAEKRGETDRDDMCGEERLVRKASVDFL